MAITGQLPEDDCHFLDIINKTGLAYMMAAVQKEKPYSRTCLICPVELCKTLECSALRQQDRRHEEMWLLPCCLLDEVCCFQLWLQLFILFFFLVYTSHAHGWGYVKCSSSSSGSSSSNSCMLLLQHACLLFVLGAP